MEWLLAIVYYFKEVISSNLDLFYFLAALFIINDIFKNSSKVLQGAVIIWFPILLYSLFQMLVIKDLDYLRAIINIIKLFLGIYLFCYIKENAGKVDLPRTAKYLSLMYIISIPVGLYFKNPLLWKLNDEVNEFFPDRLQLLYFEPSELSFQVCILMIGIIYFILNRHKPQENFIYLLGLSFIVYLSAGMGGIICLALSLMAMFLIYQYQRSSRTIIISTVLLALIAVATVLFLETAGSPLYLRAASALAGQDGSTTYRLMVGYEVMKQSLISSQGVGAGFGNLNTDYFRSLYSEYGLVMVISNSFMYFVTEGGIFGLLYLVIFQFYVFRQSVKSEILLKLPLFIFIFLYQIPGGYFTNPMNWVVYGLICTQAKILLEKSDEKGIPTDGS